MLSHAQLKTCTTCAGSPAWVHENGAPRSGTGSRVSALLDCTFDADYAIGSVST